MVHNAFQFEDTSEVVKSFTPPPTLDMEDAVDEYLAEDKNVTSPGELDWDARPEHIKNMRSAIEKTISKQWDIFETSRVLEISSVTPRISLIEVKKALIPYVKKGWFVTLSIPCSKNNDRMNTYEADMSFVTTNNYGKKDQFENIFIRMYPRTPIKKKYVSKMIKPGTFFGIPGLISIIAASIFVVIMFSAWFLIAGIALSLASLFFMTMMSGERYVMRRKVKATKKNGPLLWQDSIEGYKTAHKTITKDDRIKEVIENRVLLLSE